MDALAMVLVAGAALLAAYLTIGRWLARRVFELSDDAVTPAVELEDGKDYVPTKRSIIFGHHFTSIAGTGPIVGPAIAVMWGWLPALIWVVLGAIFAGAVHDLGSIVVSLRNKGRSIGDIAGDLLGPRARFVFLGILIVGLWIVLAIFGLVIAAVLKQYPAAILPVLAQIPLAIAIGALIHRRGASIFLASAIALGLMYLSVVFGDWGPLHTFNVMMAGIPMWGWTLGLLAYAYVASVLPVWVLLQPRDYINALQLIASLGLIVAGLVVAAVIGGAPDAHGLQSVGVDGTTGVDRPELSIVAPMIDWQPTGAPPLLPVLFITIACGACSGFHCLVGSGTTSKQITKETHARAVGYGSMLTEGFLATLVIAACAAGIGLGVTQRFDYPSSSPTAVAYPATGVPETRSSLVPGMGLVAVAPGYVGVWDGEEHLTYGFNTWNTIGDDRFRVSEDSNDIQLRGPVVFREKYASWQSAGSLAAKVGAFVEGSANLVASIGIPLQIAIALMAVMVASFAATTMDTACRLQRYVIQELSRTFIPPPPARASATNPFRWLSTTHGATLFAVVTAAMLAAIPPAGAGWSLANAGKGGLILWPLFGATNQLLAGFAFIVITAWLIATKRPWWFAVAPGVLMLIVPAAAMTWQAFVGNQANPSWWAQENWLLVSIAVVALALEAWLIAETFARWTRRGPMALGDG